MAKISDLRAYATLKGKDIRTIRGQCQAGKIPAWFDGTRWHLHPLLIPKEKSLRYFRTYFGDGDGRHPLTERDKRALEYTLVKTRLCDPEDRRKYIFYRLCDPKERQEFRDAYVKTSGRYANMLTANDWLKLKTGREPSVEEIAEHLRTSKSTLYRRCPGIKKMIEQRYRTDDSPDGVGATVDLPGGVQSSEPAVYFDYDAIDIGNSIDDMQVATEEFKKYVKWQVAMMDRFKPPRTERPFSNVSVRSRTTPSRRVHPPARGNS